MKRRIIPILLMIIFLVSHYSIASHNKLELPFNNAQATDKKVKNKEYISIQSYFLDYYENWSFFNFLEYDEYNEEYKWSKPERGCASGYLDVNIGFCWKHFYNDKIFSELSLATGCYSLEKTKIYRSYLTEFTKIRIPPLEYIFQAGIGYCFFQYKSVFTFLELSGSLNCLRAWPSKTTALPFEVRAINFAWRSELGLIYHLKNSKFVELNIGLFYNSNYYHNTGHQVRIGIGKTF